VNSPSKLTVHVPPAAQTSVLFYDADPPASAALILGHGAGAGQQSPFITGFASALAKLGVDVVTFNFLYSEQRRRLPDRAPVLEACYRAVIERVLAEKAAARSALFIGGKSMGGRIATQVAAADSSLAIKGLVLLGYPLRPPGKPDRPRSAHLPLVRRPMLFLQGSRDAFGSADELAPLVRSLTPACTLHTVDGGDHSFKLSKKDPAQQAAVHQTLQRTIVDWIDALR
jgi:predicted alpha/beta-hydrolase family hydrolase